MPRKQVDSVAVPARSSRASSPSASVSGKPAPLPLTLSAEGNASREVVRVNNASAAELKIACDDALKRLLSQPGAFKTIHLHTDVRLVLGWGSVIVSALTGLYGYKTDFETAKPVVWAGVILYIILSSAQTLYAYFIESHIVFEGKRKTLQHRIETERITVASQTLPPAAAGSAPRYALKVSYVHTTNGGKLLLDRSTDTGELAYSSWFDGKGTMDQDAFDAWVHALVSKAMGSPGETEADTKQ